MQNNSDNNNQEQGPNSSNSDQMHKLILKLRWIGMDDEAEELSARLAETDPDDHPIMEPRETD